MTNKRKPGETSRLGPMQAGSSSGARPSAFDDFAKAIIKVDGKGKETQPMASSSSSRGAQNPLRPTPRPTYDGEVALPVGDAQPMAAEESSESGNTVFYEDTNTQFHGCGGAAAAGGGGK